MKISYRNEYGLYKIRLTTDVYDVLVFGFKDFPDRIAVYCGEIGKACCPCIPPLTWDTPLDKMVTNKDKLELINQAKELLKEYIKECNE